MTAPARLVAPAAILFAAILAGCAVAEPETMIASGTVRGQDGVPLAECAVTASSLQGAAVPEVAQVTDDEGGFSWQLPAGIFLLSATCDGAEGEVTVDTSEHWNYKDLEIIVTARR